MPKLGVVIMILCACGLSALAAHAAPAVPGPAPTPAPTFRPAITGVLTLDVELTPTPSKCNEGAKAHLKLTNKTAQAWSGAISFLGQGGNTSTPVNLAAAGTDAAKGVDVVGPTLNCKKPLGTQTLSVTKQGAAQPFFTKVLKAKSVSAEQAHNAPPQTETKVWVRRGSINATCGGPVQALMTLHSFGTTTQNATTKLGFGSYVSSPSISVPPNAPTQVGAVVPTPLDCDYAYGIPSFQYSLTNGVTSSNTLEVQQVSYEP